MCRAAPRETLLGFADQLTCWMRRLQISWSNTASLPGEPYDLQVAQIRQTTWSRGLSLPFTSGNSRLSRMSRCLWSGDKCTWMSWASVRAGKN